MARKVISTPLDLNNLKNHNANYKELYNQIQATDKRLSENMWGELRNANTMKMLEPVQTADQLPAMAEDKSLVTVIDEQRVYAYVYDEWQPFNEIDLDPFEPFKDELAEIVTKYEKQIQNITNQVLSTKDTAIEAIESTQNQAESNIESTKQSSIDSVIKVRQEAENQISKTTKELEGKTSELTALFNDYLEQLTSNRNTSLAEVEDAKQEALDALADFQNTDTSNWQKYKLTQDDGTTQILHKMDWADESALDALEPGKYYATVGENTPIGSTSYNAFVDVLIRDGRENKLIIYRPYNSNQSFIKKFYVDWKDWEPSAGTKVELFSGSFSNANGQLSLNDDPRKYTYLIFDIETMGGADTVFGRFWRDYYVMRAANLGNSANGATLIETSMRVDSSDPSKVNIEGSVRVETDTASGKDYMPEIVKILGVM